jgi:tetratricopeptide (TPR) repeat protein
VSVDLLAEARRRLDAGDPASALRLAERGLDEARAAGSDERIAAAAHLVGEGLYSVGELAAARPIADEALRLSEARGDAAALGADLNLLGVLEISEGRPEAAVPLLRRSYDLRAEAGGPDDPGAIESLNNLAVALWRTGAQDEAIRLHEDALGRCERALGEEHRRTAETLNALAVKLETRPETQERSRELYERGLRSAEAALGPDSDLVARLLTNVATGRLNAGELDGVGPMLERAVELHERHFGPESRWTAYALDVYSTYALQVGQLPEARRAAERAFVIRMNELGPTDHETLEAALGLVTVLGTIAASPEPGDAMAETTALYLPLAALHPQLGDTFPDTIRPEPAAAVEQLRQVANRLAQRTEPDAAQLAAIARAKELLEEADPSYLAGDLDAAARSLEEAAALLEQARGPADSALVEPLARLVLVHRAAEDERAALAVLQRIADVLAAAYGELHPLAIRALAEVYWQERQLDPAGGSETAARIESLMRDAVGEQSPILQLMQDVLASASGADPADDSRS